VTGVQTCALPISLSDELKAAWKKAGMEAAIGMLEQARPEDIGPLVAWLASDAAANINGRTFYVQTSRVSIYAEPVEEKSITKAGFWTTDDMFELMPTITKDITNPSPSR
jgi:hypothetical protein